MKNIKLGRCIGVWLDHEKAFFIQPGNSVDSIEKVFSQIESQKRIPGESATGIQLGNYRSTNNEYRKNTKEQEQLKRYYHALYSKLAPYNYVLLLGPSTAKNEFGNFIQRHKPIHTNIVEVKGADHMTESQMMAQVSGYFTERNYEGR